MKKTLFAITVSLVLGFIACSKKTSPGKTAEVPKVTYAVEVQPLIQARCSPCHLPSKGGNKANFETYASAKNFGQDILVRVNLNPGQRGFMPFKHPKLTEQEIAVFKKWIDDGLLEK
ncbi:MAG TPA: hypothetical protein VK489_16255 [Ferruginibacter sp.]|nr:hypothetical protein [Ferruginibacter sp.]